MVGTLIGLILLSSITSTGMLVPTPSENQSINNDQPVTGHLSSEQDARIERINLPQIATAIRVRGELLESLKQEHSELEQQVAIAQKLFQGARGTFDAVIASKRELRQLQQKEIDARDSMAQLPELAKIIQDRDEADTPPKLPVESPVQPPE